MGGLNKKVQFVHGAYHQKNDDYAGEQCIWGFRVTRSEGQRLHSAQKRSIKERSFNARKEKKVDMECIL